jgi:hypothetical protein
MPAEPMLRLTDGSLTTEVNVATPHRVAFLFSYSPQKRLLRAQELAVSTALGNRLGGGLVAVQWNQMVLGRKQRFKSDLL